MSIVIVGEAHLFDEGVIGAEDRHLFWYAAGAEEVCAAVQKLRREKQEQFGLGA